MRGVERFNLSGMPCSLWSPDLHIPGSLTVRILEEEHMKEVPTYSRTVFLNLCETAAR